MSNDWDFQHFSEYHHAPLNIILFSFNSRQENNKLMDFILRSLMQWDRSHYTQSNLNLIDFATGKHHRWSKGSFVTCIVIALESRWLFIVMCDRLEDTELINAAAIFSLIKFLLCYRFLGGCSCKNMLFNLLMEISVCLLIKFIRLHWACFFFNYPQLPINFAYLLIFYLCN